VVSEDFGEARIVDLIENGRNIPVTEDNKQEYVQLVAEYRLTGSVNDQLENFLRGFNDIIPAELISIFNEQELELLISGLPDIDVDDWKANTEYHNYTPSSPQIQWFWRLVLSTVPIAFNDVNLLFFFQCHCRILERGTCQAPAVCDRNEQNTTQWVCRP